MYLPSGELVTIIKGKIFKKSLRSRLLTSYLIIITFVLLLVNFLIFLTLQSNYIDSKEKELLYDANTLSEMAIEGRLGNADYSSNFMDAAVSSTSDDSRARILIFDNNSVVINDSQNEAKGMEYHEIKEVRDALSGAPSVGQYRYGSKRILYVSSPIKLGENTIGAVLMSYSLEEIYQTIFGIHKTLGIVSALLLIIVVIFSFIMTGLITDPIKNVISAIEFMAEGELDQRVEVKGNDEIARLSNAFNNMNEKINLMDKERRQFVADASHELKSPLASIKVLVQSLLAGGINDKEISLEFLDNIDKEIDRLSNIIGNLLELTKLEGSYGMKVEVFDINDLCNDVAKKINFIAATRNVKVRYEGKSILVEGNRDNIFRAVYNIIENAVKYSNSNSYVDVWTSKGNTAKIYIKDTGIGIPQEDIPKIFERFYRVDKTRDRKTGGSGLGLSITNEIIRRHKGEIQIKSKVGEGSLFIITLPYKFEG
jgi:two-component system, OmpR family, sensor kinase